MVYHKYGMTLCSPARISDRLTECRKEIENIQTPRYRDPIQETNYYTTILNGNDQAVA